MARQTTRVARRARKNITSGVVHVNSSFNNTMITISDAQGNAISWSSAGAMGFKGSRKSTPYAAQVAADDAAKTAMEPGLQTFEVKVRPLRRSVTPRRSHTMAAAHRSAAAYSPYFNLNLQKG